MRPCTLGWLPPLMLLGAVGCVRPGPTTPAAATDSTSFPMTVTDDLGRQVTLPRPPQRVISAAPSLTEILFAVGAHDRVAAGTTLDDYPAEAKSLDRIGGVTPESVSVEKVVSLRPDLVLCTGGVQRPLVDTLEKLNVPVLMLEAGTFEGVFRNVELVGRVTGQAETAKRLLGEMRRRVDEVRRRTADLPAERRPTVFYQVWDEPLMTTTSATLIGEMIELAGGRNVFADLTVRYPQVSEEEVLRRNPAVILTAAHTGSSQNRDQILARKAWRRVDAVKNDRVVLLDGDLVSRDGPRVVAGLEAMARALHPERFPPPER